MKHILPIFLVALMLHSCGTKTALTGLTVENQDGTMPLATATPRFSWQYESRANNVVQVDYRIVVASTEQNARKGIGDLWDSKTVASNRMLYIPYGGQPLKSRDRCWWKVYATVTYGDNEKRKSIESDVQSFEISLLQEEDWHAHWIGRDFEDDSLEGHSVVAARYLRTEFPLHRNIERARLYISGLGVYRAFINGIEVAPDELLKPALSDYSQRIYFNAYDVTDNLFASGKPTGLEGDGNTVMNALGVVLAPGRFTTIRHDTNYLEWAGIRHAIHYGMPQLLMQLEVTYTDGTTDTIVSGEGWKITNRGPIRKANEFDGETYDDRLGTALGPWLHAGYDDSRWMPVVVDYDRQNMNQEERYNPRYKYEHREFEMPKPKLVPQSNPNICVQEQIKPVAIFPKGDAWILDMGQNMVGVLEIMDLSSLMGGYQTKQGELVNLKFRYAETITPDSNLYVDNLRGAECTDRYIASSVQETDWRPSFVYHGFRYVEITGLPACSKPKPNDFRGLVMYDYMNTTGSFKTSNEIINAVYRNAYWGIRGNYRSMPTDCPQRDERMGWCGDRTTGNYGESYIFDNHRLYVKWLQDIADCQWNNGQLSDVAPAYWRNYTDNMTWPGAFVTVADMLYTRFGDIDPIRQHYDAMRLWMLHMKDSYLDSGILPRDCYGDWCMPPESPELIHSKDPARITEAAAISTPFYCYLAGKMARFAQLIGRNDDVELFNRDIAFITEAYNNKYLDRQTGRYANNTVTANILPLWFGMVPKELEQQVFANIIDKTQKDFGGHVSTGVVGIQQLMRTLTEFGRGDLALQIASADTYPSWGYMVKGGATTIWELWNGDTGDPAMNSGNHVMLLGDLILWEYEYLGGIRPLEPGYSKIQLKPCPIEGLDMVECSYRSVSGLIQSNWRRDGNRFEWDILIPANTTAEVWLPSAKGYSQQNLGSGKHHLSSSL